MQIEVMGACDKPGPWLAAALEYNIVKWRMNIVRRSVKLGRLVWRNLLSSGAIQGWSRRSYR